MPSNLDRYKADLDRLVKRGEELHDVLFDYDAAKADWAKARSSKDKQGAREQEILALDFISGYQEWYSEALEVVQQLLPARLSEFRDLYGDDKSRSSQDLNTIRYWLLTPNSRHSFATQVAERMRTQVSIIRSIRRRFESSLFDIRQLVRADIFDSEVDSARELLKHGFARAAGAVAGVVLEKHLGQVCDNHTVSVKKKEPSIGDLNDLLKGANIIDTPEWRRISHLADLRNICDHNKKREPTEQEVDDLIVGTERTIKTLF